MSTKIQWTDDVWNWLVGCSRISEGCGRCYAAEAAKSARLQQFEQYQKVKDWDGKIEFVESALIKPLKWRKPKKIFTCSMSDVFHENVPFEWIDRAFAVMAIASQHTFQVLTKRPERMKEYFDSKPHERWVKYIWDYADSPCLGHLEDELAESEPLPNAWIGVTVENQKAAEKRIPVLLSMPAKVRFLSCEPLLEEIDLSQWLNGVNWVIVGGESGHKVRECKLEWIESIVQQCNDADVPCFVKQLGSNSDFKIKDRKGGEYDEFPDTVKVREFPIVAKSIQEIEPPAKVTCLEDLYNAV